MELFKKFGWSRRDHAIIPLASCSSHLFPERKELLEVPIINPEECIYIINYVYIRNVNGQ